MSDYIYQVDNLCYSYPGSSRRVLDGVSLSLLKGDIISVLGPNGCGKSTLLNCLMGLFKPEAGQVLLSGQDLSTLSFRQIARQIGYVQQSHTPSFGYTVFDFVLMGAAPKVGFFRRPGTVHEEAVWQALDKLQLTALANTPYTELSGGERQQCVIARAIAQEPLAILFDEPTAHLDYGNQLRILRLIKQMSDLGYAVIMTTHNPDHAILLGCKTAILDRQGKLSCGDSREVLTEERLRQVYETRLRLIYQPELGRCACLPDNL